MEKQLLNNSAKTAAELYETRNIVNETTDIVNNTTK